MARRRQIHIENTQEDRRKLSKSFLTRFYFFTFRVGDFSTATELIKIKLREEIVKPCWPLLYIHRRPADSLRSEVDGHFNAVGNLNEGNAFVHPVILPIECHRPFDCS